MKYKVMFKKFVPWLNQHGIVAGIVSVVAISVIVSSLYSTSPTYSKYVLDTIYYNIVNRSAKYVEITSIDPISGTFEIGSTLTAGPVTPSNATVTYQWQRSLDNENWINIVGATSISYTITENDLDCYLRVMVSGTGLYRGTVYSEPTPKIVKGSIIAIVDTDVIFVGNSKCTKLLKSCPHIACNSSLQHFRQKI